MLLVNALFIALAARDADVLFAALKWQASVLVVALILGAVAARLLTEEMRVGADEIRKCWRWRPGRFGARSVRGADLLEVAVRPRVRSKDPETVQVIGRDVTLHFGLGLDREDLEWVRDCIIAVISR
jgi:hypothetical protein